MGCYTEEEVLRNENVSQCGNSVHRTRKFFYLMTTNKITAFSRLQYTLAPALAPIPPAIAMAVEIHDWFYKSTGLWLLAVIGGVIAAAAIETSGSITAFGVLKFWHGESHLNFGLSLAGMAAYTFNGIYVTYQTPLWPFFLLSTFVYLVAAAIALSEMTTESEDKVQKIALETAKVENRQEIDLLHEKRLLVNAETRQLKARPVEQEKQGKRLRHLDEIATRGGV